jgi:hypothetical protein
MSHQNVGHLRWKSRKKDEESSSPRGTKIARKSESHKQSRIKTKTKECFIHALPDAECAQTQVENVGHEVYLKRSSNVIQATTKTSIVFPGLHLTGPVLRARGCLLVLDRWKLHVANRDKLTRYFQPRGSRASATS